MVKIAVCISLLSTLAYSTITNNRPIIGILSLEASDEHFPISSNYTTYIASSYVDFVEMGGAQVVPIKLTDTRQEITDIVSQTNGVLFTGGGSEMWKDQSTAIFSKYAEIGCMIFEQVLDINDNGHYLPLWGTCLGHELIQLCVRRANDTLSDFDGEPYYSHRLTLTQNAVSSRFFTSLDADWSNTTITTLTTTESMVFAHSYGVSLETYAKSAELRNFYNVLATSYDHDNNTFVAIIEAIDYPIYSTQFHPEKNPFEWRDSLPIPHTSEAISVSTYLANFFIFEARKNAQTFGTPSQLKPYLIYNFKIFAVYDNFETIYAFQGGNVQPDNDDDHDDHDDYDDKDDFALALILMINLILI